MTRMRTPRPSSIPQICVIDGVETTPQYACFDDSHKHKPNPEWWITEDGIEFKVGDRLYNYYDGRWGTVVSEPDGLHGWFRFQEDGASHSNSLNSVRVSSREPRR